MLKKSNQLRIIGGKWRSRKISFIDEAGVRPTKDIVRETLFNWLMHDIRGANCLDLFAGSGALGFEALSRGAGRVVFVDKSSQVIKKLRDNLVELEVPSDEFALHSLKIPQDKIPPEKFDIIFIDPPFRQELVAKILPWLVENQYVKADSLIYLETERSLKSLPIPETWQILHQKKAGQVAYYLMLVK